MNRQRLALAAALALALAILMGGVAACPGRDETTKPEGPEPAEDETGQHAVPAPEPDPCASPPCAE